MHRRPLRVAPYYGTPGLEHIYPQGLYRQVPLHFVSARTQPVGLGMNCYLTMKANRRALLTVCGRKLYLKDACFYAIVHRCLSLDLAK